MKKNNINYLNYNLSNTPNVRFNTNNKMSELVFTKQPKKKEEGDESVLSLSEQTNRPADKALHQQRIPAWNPILDPVWAIIAFFYLGIIMVPTGR